METLITLPRVRLSELESGLHGKERDLRVLSPFANLQNDS